MERILLVEPNYNNKFPPLGLMKLATYHRRKGDYVEFYKGKAPYILLKTFHRAYITSLFTFYYDITLDTVRHYLKYLHSDNVYLGGISATLLRDSYIADLAIKNVIPGQLTDSSMIGYKDSVNIDALPLDYDILDDVSYEYPAGDNFFVHATRGCFRGCPFCAVSALEPKFLNTNNIFSQVKEARGKYGDKRNVFVMDNNILFSTQLDAIVKDLNSLGFVNGESFVEPNYFEVMLEKINRRKAYGAKFDRQVDELITYLEAFASRVTAKQLEDKYQQLLRELSSSVNKVKVLNRQRADISNVIERYRFKKPLQRYVDFNQGIDARLLTQEKMRILSKIAIKPFRLAYDNVSDTPIYNKAFKTAYSHGVRHFSNYILYNYKDSPSDLWRRLSNTISLYRHKSNIHAFSFPMKYSPIASTHRDFIGEKWNKKYLSAINVILNVTKGVVVKERDFFCEAFGASIKEYKSILTMPNHFIKYRMKFKKNGQIRLWQAKFDALASKEKNTLLRYLSGDIEKSKIRNRKILDILTFYPGIRIKGNKTCLGKNIEEELCVA